MSITNPPHTSFTGDFQQAFAGLVSLLCCERIFASHGPRRGGTPKLTAWQWLMARVYHAMAMTGTFAAHVNQITKIRISDSALSQRGQSIGWRLLAEVLGEVLRPLADAVVHPNAFYHGLRLLALDGTRFNLRNTEAINSEAVKAACNKGNGQPAFANLLAMMLAASLIASQRVAVADALGVEILRVSFALVHQTTVALCQVFEVGHDLIGAEQRAEWTRRVLAQLTETAIIPKRKPRSCQRALRQPVKDWPKMKTPTSFPLTKFITLSNP